jgi:hypothetical protein
MICHDQEPLNFDFYNAQSDAIKSYTEQDRPCAPNFDHLSLKKTIPYSIHKKSILLHSELNSAELMKFEDSNLFAGAYWWSHAAIARDWYRFAEYDRSLVPNKYKKLFLTYCRDTTGSRTYRRTFLENITAQGLLDQCQISSVNGTAITSDASATYNTEDFNATAISVVLETLFDHRIHLTEKTLRPIACGHPFILVAGPGSLQLLRNYGFRTFAGYINESYDEILDETKRLAAVCAEMKRITQLPLEQRNQLIKVCQKIADHNRKHFFSDKFFKQITSELEQNVAAAFHAHQGELDVGPWWRDHKWRRINKPELCKSPAYKKFSKYLIKFCRQAGFQRRGKIPVQSRPGSCSL